MVNTGKPSSGCFTCRSRRVKCDGVRPSCLRCQKLRRTCQGYRDINDLLFKDQTRKTIETATKFSRMRSRPRNSLLFSRIDSSLCLFFTDYIAKPHDEASPGYLEFLPSMYLEADAGSSLPKAVHAVALMHTYNLGSHLEVKYSAQQWYGDALHSINEVLQDPMKRLNDDSLLAIWLIGLYEVGAPSTVLLATSLIVTSQLIAGDLQQVIEKSSTFTSHVKGMTTLLQVRGAQKFRTRRARSVFFLVLGTSMMYALMAGLPSPIPDWQKWYDKPKDANTLTWPGTRANSFHIQVTDLCSEMRSLASPSHKCDNIYGATLRIKEVALHLQKSVLRWPCDGAKF
ncbi:hypothetical protein LTR17_010859 [Elasticomyces elasticus]|nr:hypothetical protein LTR17_010859 [Elasticomyces elasticus]